VSSGSASASASASASTSIMVAPSSAPAANSASPVITDAGPPSKATSSLSLEEIECEEFAAQIEFEDYACSFEN
jgi:hypothetical protein